jgi:hypothetical protein
LEKNDETPKSQNAAFDFEVEAKYNISFKLT